MLNAIGFVYGYVLHPIDIKKLDPEFDAKVCFFLSDKHIGDFKEIYQENLEEIEEILKYKHWLESENKGRGLVDTIIQWMECHADKWYTEHEKELDSIEHGIYVIAPPDDYLLIPKDAEPLIYNNLQIGLAMLERHKAGEDPDKAISEWATREESIPFEGALEKTLIKDIKGPYLVYKNLKQELAETYPHILDKEM